MRVVWISVGLLGVFLVALLTFSEPKPEVARVAETNENQSTIESPFVEESSVESPKDKRVELAKLPTTSDSTPVAGVANTVPPNTVNLIEKPEEKTAEVNSPEIVSPVNVESVAPAKVASTPEKLETKTTENTQPPETSKKLGLAMIVLEKERKKNKIAVIVHETNTQELTEKEIKALYLDRMTRWQDGSKVMLFNLPLGDKYRDKFSTSILKMTALEADKQEAKRRELHIKANDVEVKSKNVVVSYVEQNPNAVAYVPLNLVREKSNVKVVLTIP